MTPEADRTSSAEGMMVLWLDGEREVECFECCEERNVLEDWL